MIKWLWASRPISSTNSTWIYLFRRSNFQITSNSLEKFLFVGHSKGRERKILLFKWSVVFIISEWFHIHWLCFLMPGRYLREFVMRIDSRHLTHIINFSIFHMTSHHILYVTHKKENFLSLPSHHLGILLMRDCHTCVWKGIKFEWAFYSYHSTYSVRWYWQWRLRIDKVSGEWTYREYSSFYIYRHLRAFVHLIISRTEKQFVFHLDKRWERIKKSFCIWCRFIWHFQF